MSRMLLQRSARLQLRPCAMLPVLQTRHNSDFSKIQEELPARRIPPTYDYFNPTASHLLSMSLADTLGSVASNINPRILPAASSPTPLPPTHHLVYFPATIPGAELLPDGTDPAQSPGPPFVRRMWAGGSVYFNNSRAGMQTLAVDGKRTVVIERIRDVTVKGKSGEEKIFVGIERRVGKCDSDQESEDSIRNRLERDSEQDFGDAGVVERRNIVFMHERSKEQGIKDLEKAREKVMRPPEGKPDFERTLTTDGKLLFRYSALTYNAHAIHLDPEYCREVEGHPERLVHGPLSFTLLMTALRMHLKERGAGELLKSVEYRNLSPIYCGDKLKVAGREKEDGKWEVWIENKDGGLGLRGTVKTEKVGDAPFADLAMLGY